MPLSASILVYNSLVDSFLRYGVVSWGTCANTLKLHLQRIQGRIIESLNSTRFPYQNNTNDAPITILNLPNIYTHETAKFMHSVTYKYCPPAFNDCFTEVQHNHDTRFRTNSHFKLIRPRTNLGKKSIKYSGIQCWVKIPQTIKSIEKLGNFSKQLKTHLLSQQRHPPPPPAPVDRIV